MHTYNMIQFLNYYPTDEVARNRITVDALLVDVLHIKYLLRNRGELPMKKLCRRRKSKEEEEGEEKKRSATS